MTVRPSILLTTIVAARDNDPENRITSARFKIFAGGISAHYSYSTPGAHEANGSYLVGLLARRVLGLPSRAGPYSNSYKL